MVRIRIGLAAAMTLITSTTSMAQLRIVNYNIAQLNGNQAALENVFAALAADDKPGFAVAPHMYFFQEVQSGDVGPLLTRLNNAAPAGVVYTQGTYTNTNENGVAGAQAMFYRADMLTEDAALHRDFFTGAGRRADRWFLQLVAYDAPTAGFYVYSAHLKAGSSTSDQNTRSDGAQVIRNNADNRPAGSLILYGGDWNVKTNTEQAYLDFIAAGPGQAVDPFGNGSWSGPGNAIKHTQSPQDSTGALVGGGMDDRFDFQLGNAPWHDAEGLDYIPGTYRSFGNDGNHYNVRINLGNNTYYPADIPRSNALADDLFSASDHIPVIVDYQLPASMSASLPSDFGRVIQTASVTIDLMVDNVAPVVEPTGIGADELDYTVATSGGLSGSASGSVLATIPATPDVVQIGVDTSTIGPVAGSAQITSTSDAVQNGDILLNASGTVLRAADASFDSGSDLGSVVLTRIVSPDAGVESFSVSVYNHGFDANQAALDIDSVDPPPLPFSFDGGLASGIGATPAVLAFSFDTAGLGPSVFNQPIGIHVSDEDIPGESTATLNLTLDIRVRTLIGDVNDDCVVDLEDLTQSLGSFGRCAGESRFNPGADLNNDGCVTLDDLVVVLAQFGEVCP